MVYDQIKSIEAHCSGEEAWSCLLLGDVGLFDQLEIHLQGLMREVEESDPLYVLVILWVVSEELVQSIIDQNAASGAGVDEGVQLLLA